jgi:hypothetical protein
MRLKQAKYQIAILTILPKGPTEAVNNRVSFSSTHSANSKAFRIQLG